ncbi:transcriptional regulator [Ancylobacter sp. 6x-1]|uniref:Transcriptional regulator n=1 Tax=Ancylobacter crimeensis TaxID=2579147 RepID=A0ABT0D696_9HYPH|nr:transcriptional regulator [Ancylobacter crimeensis]
MAHTWKHDRAKSSIDKRIEDVRTVSVVDWTRDKSLEDIPTNKAYRMDAVHLYVDIPNLRELLDSTAVEGPTCHKRTLRFLNLHYRAVERILSGAEARRVDFHNQRLHAVVSKPYGSDSEADRVRKAVAVAQLISDVLAETGDDDEQIPNADVRIGIDTGLALAVNNGRNGYREPLFLGSPANKAAKLASNGTTLGIFLSNSARRAIGLEELDEDDVPKTPLTEEEISACQEAADLDVDKDSIVDAWRKDNEKSPIGTFEFSRSTPPLRDLEITSLSPANSRRMDTVSVYADVDNFTAYVDAHIEDDEQAKDVVRCLHVIRAELDRVLTADFGGRRIRFIGDCIHGHILEGTAHQTYDEETVSTATLCAGALRSSFDLALERLQANGIDTDDLGLAIGFEFGPTAITRLGMRGDKVRCSVGRAVLGSEDEQRRCTGSQTAIGDAAYGVASDAVRELFGKAKIVPDLTYDTAVSALSEDGDKVAKAAVAEAYALSSPALARAAEEPFRPHCTKD